MDGRGADNRKAERHTLTLKRNAVAETARRLKVLVLTPDALTDLIHHRKRPRVPTDTRVLCDQTKVGDRNACWLITSASFELLAPGQPPPAVYPAMDVIS